MAAFRVDRVPLLGEGDSVAEGTIRRGGSSGQGRMWVVAVLGYLVLLAVCLTMISVLAQSWVDRAGLVLAIVGLYGFAFTLISSTLGRLSGDFADGMTSPNLRDFLGSNLFTLSVAFAVAAPAFQTVLYRGAAAAASDTGTRKRPRFALLTSFGAAVVVVAYAILHMVFVCPLTYLFYLPGSHFLNVVLAAPAAGRMQMTLTDGEEETPDGTATSTGTPRHQQRVLDVVEALGQNQATFRNLFATALAAVGALALQVTT